MSTVQITLLKTPVAKQDGKFQKMDLLFSRDGKPQTRKLVAINKTKDIFPVLTQGKEGDVFNIEMEKDGDYWNWIKAELANGVGDSAAPEVKAQYVAKSTYETADERARKQVYITRIAAVNAAIEYHKAQGKKFEVAEALDTASLIASFVFQTNGSQTIDEARLNSVGEYLVASAKGGEFQDDNPF